MRSDIIENRKTYVMRTFACKTSEGRKFADFFFQTSQNIPNLHEMGYFQNDVGRIMFCNSFRKLQYKHPILGYYGTDNCKNILTRTVITSYYTRALSDLLGLNSALSESIALAYSLGTPVFAESGKSFADEILEGQNKFLQKFYSFKVVTQLENFHFTQKGLNLSKELLEGLLKYDGNLKDMFIPEYVREYRNGFDINLYSNLFLEGQVFKIVNEFVTVLNDFEDAFHAKLISIFDFYELNFIIETAQKIMKKANNLSNDALIFEVGKVILQKFIYDIVYVTEQNIKKLGIISLADIRSTNEQIVQASQEQMNRLESLRQLLFEKVYMHPKAVFLVKKFKNILQSLYKYYSNNIDLLTQDQRDYIQHSPEQKNIIILDWILSMSDKYALEQYRKIFNASEEIDKFA